MRAEPSGPAWDRAVRRLTQAEGYWLVTSGASGRPTARPIWAVWLSGELWFGSASTTRKSRDLAQNPRASVHLASPDDVLIVEGIVEAAAASKERDRAAKRLADKYRLNPGELDLAAADTPGGWLYVLHPKVVRTWFEGLFPETQAVWPLS